MTYLLLDAIFVGVAGVVLLLARGRARVGVGAERPSGLAIAWTVLGLAITTAVFDNLMIAAGLFEFADEHLVGLFVGRAPVEDVGYPLAAALLLPALWHLLGARAARRRPVPVAGAATPRPGPGPS